MVRKCSPDQMINPATGYCVKRDGKIGKAILKKSVSPKQRSGKKCPSGKILNPATGRCVNRDGKIGKTILNKKNSPKQKSRKSKSPKQKSRKSKSPKQKSRKSKSPKQKSHKSKSPKQKSHKSKSPSSKQKVSMKNYMMVEGLIAINEIFVDKKLYKKVWKSETLPKYIKKRIVKGNDTYVYLNYDAINDDFISDKTEIIFIQDSNDSGKKHLYFIFNERVYKQFVENFDYNLAINEPSLMIKAASSSDALSVASALEDIADLTCRKSGKIIRTLSRDGTDYIKTVEVDCY